MSLNLDIVDILRKNQGRIRADIKLTNTQTIQPPKGTIWFIIGGCIYHVTGSGSGFNVRSEKVTGSPAVGIDVQIHKSNIDSADATYIYPIFNNTAEPTQTAWYPMIVTSDNIIAFLGAATAWFKPLILEVKL